MTTRRTTHLFVLIVAVVGLAGEANAQDAPLYPSQELVYGQNSGLVSPNGFNLLVLSCLGIANYCGLYVYHDDNGNGYFDIWPNNEVFHFSGSLPATGPHPYNQGLSKVRMQEDGNLVLHNAAGTPIWESGTAGNPGAWLNVQNDGNVVIYTTSGVPIWSLW